MASHDANGPTQSALFTDLQTLSMMSSYYELGMEETAAFEFSVRPLVGKRNFLVAAGLEQVLDYLEELRFTADDLAWLASTGRFRQGFLDRLKDLRFTGDVYAMPEGTVCFGDEPMVRIHAPLPQAQLLESRLINLLHFQTLIASKAARCRIAAGKCGLVEFGLRRAHSAESAVLAARASYIAGFNATSNVAAARRFGIPLCGTMAHSFIQAHDVEADAFRAFAGSSCGDITLLIDTYDTQNAARHVVQFAQELQGNKVRIRSVRIDSGDLTQEVPRVRAILDEGGCQDIEIFVTGGVDEHSIASLVRAGVHVDSFGVGTALTVSSDAPALDCIYKLQQYAGVPRRKCSAWKSTWPGRRQVHRLYDDCGRIAMDVVSCVDEIVEGKELLQQVMVNGRRTATVVPLQDIRHHCVSEIATLPAQLLSLDRGPRSPVKISHGLHELAHEVDKRREQQALQPKQASAAATVSAV